MSYRTRETDLLVRTVGDETVIYDRAADKFLRLNASASIVWRCCQRGASIAEVAQKLSEETELPRDEEVAKLAILELLQAGLLTGDAQALPPSAELTRRSLMQRFAAAAVLLPLVQAMVAPTPAQAASY